MIIYPEQGAGLCNRLHAAAHLLAHAEETGNTVYHFALRQYAGIFEGIPINGVIIHRPSKPRQKKILRLPFFLLRSGRFPPGEINLRDSFVQQVEQTMILFLVGWRFRNPEALMKHSTIIKSLFRPVMEYRKAVTACMNKLRTRCDRVVGIHMRRGDYETYRKGCYFYDDSVYRRVMGDIRRQLGSETGFLLTSDAPINLASFNKFIVQCAPGDEIVDLYSLAQCDLLVGPPSTYSTWAGFYGAVPVIHLLNVKSELEDLEVLIDSRNRLK